MDFFVQSAAHGNGAFLSEDFPPVVNIVCGFNLDASGVIGHHETVVRNVVIGKTSLDYIMAIPGTEIDKGGNAYLAPFSRNMICLVRQKNIPVASGGENGSQNADYNLQSPVHFAKILFFLFLFRYGVILQ